MSIIPTPPTMSWAAILAARSTPKQVIPPFSAKLPEETAKTPVVAIDTVAPDTVAPDMATPEFTAHDPTLIDNICSVPDCKKTANFGIIGHSNNRTYHKLFCAACYHKIKRNEAK